ncbi:MAG: hypothetical protein KatS3mg110_1466 [Pirellulaceae bacterium]|nr:MAG: hypothetical protein KatS3mg110_1466 [Pirellulaceae bacterium]
MRQSDRRFVLLPYWQAILEKAGLEPGRREAEVLWLLLAFRSDKWVARQLGVSVSTIRNHVGRLLRRFGARNRMELAFAIMETYCNVRYNTPRRDDGPDLPRNH